MNTLGATIRSLPGPILVIGASGFLGANLFRTLREQRRDVFGTTHAHAPWRLEGVSRENLLHLDLLLPTSLQDAMETIAPAVVFNCSSYGAYSFEADADRIHRTNYLSTISLLESCERMQVKAYVNAGSSSEYGFNCAAPTEDAPLFPDSHYAVSKAAAAQAIRFYGKARKLPCANLRLYSLYGPYEDSSRLIPVLAERVLRGELPTFAHPETSRDFVYVGDAVEAFITAAARIRLLEPGASYNIGSGVKTTLGELAELARAEFHISEPPQFSSTQARAWDHGDWYAAPSLARETFGWQAGTPLRDGLAETVAWWKEFLATHQFGKLTKKHATAGKNSLSVVIACYRDGQAIPIMHERLTKVLTEARLDYEIIFVNDASPDDSTRVITEISARDPQVVGIVHSRNFGSQAAFRSGMEIATKEACVLMDGDLQDPPELIPVFVEKWRAGADVVYGNRVRREMPAWLEFFYKCFYATFSAMSEIVIPKNAGDFSLIDRTAVRWILRCRERDSFLRGLRAYVGFRQEGVDYVRPERMFGRSTNNWIKNIGWAKKAIFSFSRLPLHLLTAAGGIATAVSVLLGVVMALTRIIAPSLIPAGIPTVLLLVAIFGSLNLLGLGLLGEYIGKIIEETKQRPPFIRVLRIERGEMTPWRDTA